MNYIYSGFESLSEYVSAHVLTCLIPAFFIAGAIAVFISQAAVMKYFGPQAKKVPAYLFASISGAVLAVCSCTILPLFAGIRQRGAGLGPAIAFLYSGPAINILAVVYSARLLGIDLGIARAAGAVIFSIVIGLIMSAVFRREEAKIRRASEDIFSADDAKARPLSKSALFFGAMTAFLIAASSIGLIAGIELEADHRISLSFAGGTIPALIALIMLAAVIIMAVKWFTGAEAAEWMRETWKLLWKIVPLLLLGVFIAGIIKEMLPQEVVQRWVGGNSLGNNLLSSVFGALMYFSTLTEVPIVKALMELGMGKGPALTLLLAGPSLSLPNMIVIGGVMGFKRTVVYVALVIAMATLTGMIFGAAA